MAAHVGVLRVQGKDGLQEREDNEPCHRERHPGPCAGEQKGSVINQPTFPGIRLALRLLT